MVVGNIKGALSMAAVLALPEDLAYRGRIVTIVFGVTFVTLLTQALPFGHLLRVLEVTLRTNAAEDRAKATLIAARRGQSELAELLATGLVSRKDHAHDARSFSVRSSKPRWFSAHVPTSRVSTDTSRSR